MREKEGAAMFGEILLVLIGIALIVGVFSIVRALLRGPDARRRKALVALLLNREMNADGSMPRTSARERRAAKHAAWAEQLRHHEQTTHHYYGSSSEGGHHGGGYSDHGFHGGGFDGGHGGHH